MSLLGTAICDIAPGSHQDRIALLMLPAAKTTPQQLVEHGFIQSVRARGQPADVMALNAHADYYLERAGIERLLHETLDEVRARGYRRIWLLGISLGGLGSMLCVTQRTTDIEGAVLLAPFLGTSGIIAEVRAGGGLRQWRMKEGDNADYERAFLARLQTHPFPDPGAPRIYLGYGREDRFRGASALLAELLPHERILTLPGGHDWPTWRALWDGLLDLEPFSLP